jgi:hypothetical protein
MQVLYLSLLIGLTQVSSYRYHFWSWSINWPQEIRKNNNVLKYKIYHAENEWMKDERKMVRDSLKDFQKELGLKCVEFKEVREGSNDVRKSVILKRDEFPICWPPNRSDFIFLIKHRFLHILGINQDNMFRFSHEECIRYIQKLYGCG